MWNSCLFQDSLGANKAKISATFLCSLGKFFPNNIIDILSYDENRKNSFCAYHKNVQKLFASFFMVRLQCHGLQSLARFTVWFGGTMPRFAICGSAKLHGLGCLRYKRRSNPQAIGERWKPLTCLHYRDLWRRTRFSGWFFGNKKSLILLPAVKHSQIY